jgi:hypothetical protein
MKTHTQEAYRVICDAHLDAEELEAVIAPKLGANHNETFVGAPAGRS